MAHFATYEEARDHAQAQANRLRRDVGLERASGLLGGGYTTLALPASRFRQGHELRCEVVSPGLAEPERTCPECPQYGAGYPVALTLDADGGATCPNCSRWWARAEAAK